jgi:hypothetical protein
LRRRNGPGQECFEAAAKLLPNATLSPSTVSSSTLPTGCTVERGASGHIAAVFNKQAGSSAPCGGTASTLSGTATSLVQLHLSLDKAHDGA